MMFRKIAMITALSLAVASTSAVAQTAQPLSLTNSPVAARAGVDMQGDSQLEGVSTTLIIVGVIVAGLLIWGAIELFGSDSDNPSSP